MLTDCGEYRPRLIELARGTTVQDERRALMAHVELCADCARVLDEQMALSAALGSLAGEALPEMAEIEVRVLAEFDRARKTRRFRLPIVAPVMAPLAACLAAAVLIGVVAIQRRPQVVRPEIAPAVEAVESPAPVAVPLPRQAVAPIAKVRHVVTPRQATPDNRPFLPIPYTVPLAPEERATVVRMQIPVAALIAAGFDVATADPGAVMDADVLVSQDGRARAIRF